MLLEATGLPTVPQPQMWRYGFNDFMNIIIQTHSLLETFVFFIYLKFVHGQFL